MSGSGGSGGSNGCKGEKRNFLAQPVVKTIFVYRNGDSYSEARRVLIHEKRVCDLDGLLREVTGRIRAPFGAVRTIYTPRAGHRVDSLDYVQNGEQYVAAGTEKFRKINYLQIQNRRKRMLQNNEEVKPVPQSRVVVSARFLKPIKEPCAIFVVANGDVLNPAVRFLVPNRLLDQFERILEMITEKMGLRILGGVRSLCTFDGALITDGKELENGQFYVAVGRDKFKRLPYADLLFFKPISIRRNVRSKACSLPPIYRYGKRNGEVNGVGKGDSTETKVKKPVVRQISQARPMTLHKKRSNLRSLSSEENDEGEQKVEDEDEESEDKSALEDPSLAEQENCCEDEETGEEGVEENKEATEEPAVEVEAAEESTELAEDAGAGDVEANVEDEAAAAEPAEDEVAAEGGGGETDEAVGEDEAVAETLEENEAEGGDEAAGNDEAAGEDEAVTQTTNKHAEEGGGEEEGGDDEVAVGGEGDDGAGEEEEPEREEDDGAGGEDEAEGGEEEETGGEEEQAAGGEDEAAGAEEEENAGEEDEAAGGEEEEAAGGEDEAAGGEEEEDAGGEDEAAGEQGEADDGAADNGGGDDS